MLTRREVLATGTAFTGYALSVETVLAQAIHTDTNGLTAGDYKIPVASTCPSTKPGRPAAATS